MTSCSRACPPRPQEQQRQGPNVLCWKGDCCEPAARGAGRPGSTAAGRAVSSGGDSRRVLHASLATIQLQTGQTEAEEERHEGGAGVCLRAQPAPRATRPYRRLRLRDVSALQTAGQSFKNVFIFKSLPPFHFIHVSLCVASLKEYLIEEMRSNLRVKYFLYAKRARLRLVPNLVAAASVLPFIHPQAPSAPSGTDKQTGTHTHPLHLKGRTV